MAAAMEERTSAAAGTSAALARAQAAADAACQPALQHLAAARAALGGAGDPAGAALATALQAAAELLGGLPAAEAELAGFVGALCGAVERLAAGFDHVAAMAAERDKVGGRGRACTPQPTEHAFVRLPSFFVARTLSHALHALRCCCQHEQVHQILSSVNSQLRAAASAHPSRLALAEASPPSPHGGSLAGDDARQDGGGGGGSLLALLQQLTQTVVGLVEGLAAEKELLEARMLHAADEAEELRRQVPDAARSGPVPALPLLCVCVWVGGEGRAVRWYWHVRVPPSPTAWRETWHGGCPSLPLPYIALPPLFRHCLPPSSSPPATAAGQAASSRAVLASLQSHTALEHQEALLELEHARSALAAAQQDNAELAERAQRAQRAVDALRASASHEWTAVRDDLSSLVQQAEVAQLGADAALRRQRDEYEERLARAAKQAEQAAAARQAAEAAAEELQRQLDAARRELGVAKSEAEAAGRKLEAGQAGVRELEGRVAELQRQLAQQARRGGISVSPTKKAAAASSAAAALKRENGRLRSQAEALQERVAQLEGHVQRGVQQLRQARELAEAAQRTVADAGGWEGWWGPVLSAVVASSLAGSCICLGAPWPLPARRCRMRRLMHGFLLGHA
jgi:hypothetical protein